MRISRELISLAGIALTLSACSKSPDAPTNAPTVSNTTQEARQTQRIANLELIEGLLKARLTAAVIMNWEGETYDIPKGKSEIEHTEDLTRKSLAACLVLAEVTESLSKPSHNPPSAVEEARRKTLDRNGIIVDEYTDYIRGYSRNRAECETIEKENTESLDEAKADRAHRSENLQRIRYYYLYRSRAGNETAIRVLTVVLHRLRQEGDVAKKN